MAERAARHDAAPFPRREGSRLQCFLEEERPLLRPLLAAPFEACGRACGRKVQANCHVSYARSFYSAGCLPPGREAGPRAAGPEPEAPLGGGRAAAHPLFPSCARNRYPADAGDMPEGGPCSDRGAPRVRRWADGVGPSCREAAGRPFAPCDHGGRALDGCLAVLRLSNRCSAPRLERACAMALAAGKRSPRYRDVEPILKTNQDRLAEAGDGGAGPDEAGYVRGASFYGRE